MPSEQAKYEPIARRAASAVGIDDDLFVRQITQESGWQSDVIHCQRDSSAGARGVAQIVPRFHPTVDPCDPIAALEYAAGLMRSHLAVHNGDWALALSAYNAGPGATAQGLAGTLSGWPYAETVRYVANILEISQDEARRRLTGQRTEPLPRVRFDPEAPPIRQNDPWSCAPTSARWAMTALGRYPSEAWFEDTMLADGVVTRQLGLMDASGAGLAAFIGRHYGEFGYYANHEPLVTFEGVALEGDHAYPLLIGGHRWGHWSGVRGYDAVSELLLLANPAAGWHGIHQTMNRQQFDALGPFSMVRVLHPDLLEPAPQPEPPAPIPDPVPIPVDTRLERARVAARELLAILEEVAP